MACEQNATHLENCKSKSNIVETVTLTATVTADTTLNEVTIPEAMITPSPFIKTTPLNSFATRGHDSQSRQESTVNAAFESSRIVTPTLVSQKEPSREEERKANSIATVLATLGDNLSTTTLIPPALFVEPTVSNLVFDDFPSQFDQVIAMTLANTLPTGTTMTTALNFNLDTTTPLSSSPKMEVSEPLAPTPAEHREEPALNDSLPKKVNDNSSRDITLEFPSKPAKLEYLPASKHSKKYANNNLEQILKDLDMSNFDISGEPYLASYSALLAKKSNAQHSPESNYAFFTENHLKSAQPTKASSESSKFSLSIHKFFRESLPSTYLRNVPKILRSLNAMRDYETSVYDSKSPIMPRKNDQTSRGTSRQGDEPKGISMLSIPVLVPVNLSQEDYRRRMSASVLKPIVIPLKEKGKMIPAYVLQFASSRRTRSKRSALNGKRLLSLPLKPTLLYQVLPSILKNVYGKPTASSAKQATQSNSNARIKANFDLLMAAQSMLPSPFPLPPGQTLSPAQMASFLKLANTYDLSEFQNQFIPPYYFLEQHPYLHYRPIPVKKGLPLKRPPPRSKIPLVNVASNHSSAGHATTTPSSGLLAVDSSLNGQVVRAPTLHPNSPFLYGGLASGLTGPPTSQTPTTFSGYLPSAFNNAYPPPLHFFGSNLVGADPSKFMPVLKKSTLLRKLKDSKNAFNPKGETPTEPSAPNMPANIYVPDDIIEDIQLENPMEKSNLSTSALDNSIDHSASTDLMEHFRSDESRPIEVYARYNQTSLNVLRNGRAMREQDHKAKTRELSSQAKINANFFNGTSVKVSAMMTLPESPRAGTVTSVKVPRDQKNSIAYQRHDASKTTKNSGNNAVSEESAYSIDSGHEGTHFNLATYLRHLKASESTDNV